METQYTCPQCGQNSSKEELEANALPASDDSGVCYNCPRCHSWQSADAYAVEAQKDES